MSTLISIPSDICSNHWKILKSINPFVPNGFVLIFSWGIEGNEVTLIRRIRRKIWGQYLNYVPRLSLHKKSSFLLSISYKILTLNRVDIYLVKVNNTNTWRRSGVFIDNFEHISHCSNVSIVNLFYCEHVIAAWGYFSKMRVL